MNSDDKNFQKLLKSMNIPVKSNKLEERIIKLSTNHTENNQNFISDFKKFLFGETLFSKPVPSLIMLLAVGFFIGFISLDQSSEEKHLSIEIFNNFLFEEGDII